MSSTQSDLPAADLLARLHSVQSRILAAAHACGRNPADITLVAVSKTHDKAAIAALIAAGHTVFGENRVQEAAGKFADRPSSVRLHLIGALQTNKAEDAVRLADVIEALDRPSLADAIDRAASRAGRCPDLLVQINTGAEPQKAGIAPDAAPAFITAMRHRFGDKLTGLMCIPPVAQDPVPHFRALAALAASHGLSRLSMGMSADYEAAIACGATSVRVGSAIFGTRLRRTAATA